MQCSLEELVVALADTLWKGKRNAALEKRSRRHRKPAFDDEVSNANVTPKAARDRNQFASRGGRGRKRLTRRSSGYAVVALCRWPRWTRSYYRAR
jgi:hypothetical protein